MRIFGSARSSRRSYTCSASELSICASSTSSRIRCKLERNYRDSVSSAPLVQATKSSRSSSPIRFTTASPCIRFVAATGSVAIVRPYRPGFFFFSARFVSSAARDSTINFLVQDFNVSGFAVCGLFLSRWEPLRSASVRFSDFLSSPGLCCSTRSTHGRNSWPPHSSCLPFRFSSRFFGKTALSRISKPRWRLSACPSHCCLIQAASSVCPPLH